MMQETIGEKIVFLRKNKELTQAQLAEKLGISAQAVSKWESGLSCPDIMVLVPLARILGVTVDNLLSGERPEESIQDSKESRMAEAEKDIDSKGAAGLAGADYKLKEKIRSLHIELGAAEVFLREGKDFSLEMVGYGAGESSSLVKDGVWTISDHDRNYFMLVGMRNFFKAHKAIVTVPKGYCFEELKLSIGAGTITAECVSADSWRLDVGAGVATLFDIHSSRSEMKCGMGEIKLRGSVSGLCKIECGMGSVTADLAPLAEYGYKINVGMGDVKLGENRVSGMGGCHKVNGSAENFFDVECGMGEVNIQFLKGSKGL